MAVIGKYILLAMNTVPGTVQLNMYQSKPYQYRSIQKDVVHTRVIMALRPVKGV
jgi:hypothetical protein